MKISPVFAKGAALALGLALASSAEAQSAPPDKPAPKGSAKEAFSALSRAGEAKPLSLKDAVRTALENAPDLDVAAATSRAAAARYEQAKDARLPAFSVGANLNQFTSAVTFCPAENPQDGSCLTEEIVVRPATTIGAQATIAVPLTPQYALKKRVDAAGYDVEATEISREITKREIIWQTEQAYLQLLKARAVKEATLASVQLAEAQVERVRRYYEAGALAKNELLKAELGLAQAQQGDIQAEAAVLLSESSLAMTIGLAPGVRIEPTEDYPTEVPPIPVSIEEAMQAAQEKRPELAQLDAQIEMTRSLRDASKMALYPSISAVGNLQYSPGQAFADEFQAFATLNLSWNVWDWGLARDQIEIAESGLAQVESGREKLELGLGIDVRSRYLTLLGAQASLEVAQKSIESAQENLRIVEARFDAKAATTTDLLDAQVLLTRATVSEITARYDYYIALAGLRKAMGEPLGDRYLAEGSSPAQAAATPKAGR